MGGSELELGLGLGELLVDELGLEDGFGDEEWPDEDGDGLPDGGDLPGL
jgi:hypothetical protein